MTDLRPLFDRHGNLRSDLGGTTRTGRLRKLFNNNGDLNYRKASRSNALAKKSGKMSKRKK